MTTVEPPHDTVGAFVDEPRILLSGPSNGSLAGQRLAVKDLFDVAGTVTGAGNPEYAATHEVADTTAAAVEALVGAGATVVGKTITDELAFSLSGTNTHYGTPVNTAAPDRIPGGSSAGSAAAVAAGLVELALGTDTGGSIRVPASYCGLAGWRPTHGAVPIDGVVPLAPSFDTVGLLAATVDRLIPAAAVLLGGAGGATVADPVRSVVGFAEAFADVEPAVADAIRSAVSVGDDVDVGLDLAAVLDAQRTIQTWEAWQEHGAWITQQRPALGVGIAARFASGASITAADVDRAGSVRNEVRRRAIAATAGGRVLAMPAAAGPAPRRLELADDADRADYDSRRVRTLRLTATAGMAGLPVVVVPIADVGGLPVGVAFVGAPGSDIALLTWAAATYGGR